MNNSENLTPEIDADDQESTNRRELVRKVGKFAAYAAPFTILAATGKASAGHGSGGGPGARPRPGK